MQNVRLPEVFVDAKNCIEGAIEENMKVSIKSHGSMFSNLSDIVHYHIEDAEEESYANLDLFITFKKRVMSEKKFEVVEITKNLKVLNTAGDSKWTFRMINKIWDGEYPSTVAVDMETGEVYFFSVKVNRIELTRFGKMDEVQFDAFLVEVNDREPFKIKIDEDAMFEYIDGAEGLNHLQKNIYVEFNCGLPIKVKSIPVSVLD